MHCAKRSAIPFLIQNLLPARYKLQSFVSNRFCNFNGTYLVSIVNYSISSKSIYCYCCTQYSDKKFEYRLLHHPRQQLRSYEHHQEDLQGKLYHNDDRNIASLLEQEMISYLNLLFPLKSVSCCFFTISSILDVFQYGLLHLGHTFGLSFVSSFGSHL